MATEEPTSPGPVPDHPEPSPQEAMLFFNILKNVKNQPDIDWDQVAKDTGFKNEATAKVKLKLGLDSRAGSSPSKSPGKSPTKSPGKPRKRTAASQDEPDAGDTLNSASATPTKATKRRKTAAATITTVCPADGDSTDVMSAPATPTNSVPSASFTPINGSPTTPSKAKPKERTPAKARKTAAAAAQDELAAAGAVGLDSNLEVKPPVKNEDGDSGEV